MASPDTIQSEEYSTDGDTDDILANSWVNRNGNRNVAYLWNDNGNRKLNLNWYENMWNDNYRFLAVCKHLCFLRLSEVFKCFEPRADHFADFHKRCG